MAFSLADLLTISPTGPRLLIYHQVGTNHGHQMEVTTEAFVKQMEWLSHRREVVPLANAVDSWQESEASNLVVLTFDDGYRDLYTTAFPILRDLGLPFTLYITTGLVSDEESDDAREHLSWREVEEMCGSGLTTVGAHTRHHPDMRTITRSEVEREVSESNDEISSRLGLVPEHFAYPYGFWSETADDVIRSEYKTAVLGGTHRPQRDPDPFLLHRYPVQLSDGILFFKARLRGGFRAEEAVRRRLKGYEGP